MKMRKILMMAAACIVVNTHADIVVRNSYSTYFGYGSSGWTTFSSMLDVASGGTMQPAVNLENTPQVSGADALWIDMGGSTAVLSSTEILNIQNFIATGKRVVMIGENVGWAGWNNQITGLLGGSASGSNSSGPATPILTHELTAGVSSIDIPASGQPLGGTALFSQSVASLYGSLDNVLVILDINMFSETYIGNSDNSVFTQNVANWIAVPEPASLGLLGLVSGGIFFTRRIFTV